ncbi:MAG: hypothetical protein ABII82_04280 [Verrucomicrobiota bacterium]
MPTPLPPGAPRSARRRLLPCLVPLLLCLVAPLRAGWGEDAIKKECDYIVNCSFTTYAVNNSQAQVGDAAYGTINVVRIASAGADWVNPGESAIAAVGLMEGAKKLWQLGVYTTDVARYDAVLDAFFYKWVNGSSSGLFVTSGTDAGGARSRVYYNVNGSYSSANAPTSAATGQILVASWKYYEYLVDTNQTSKAANWLWWSRTFAQNAGAFLNAAYHTTYQMNAGRPSVLTTSDLWISDASWAQVGMRVLSRYQAYGLIPAPSGYTYAGRADSLASGLAAMKDPGGWKNFYRYRACAAGYAARYGDKLDQLCFLPYETDSLSVGETYCGELSDWWTTGGVMTPNSTNSSIWTFYGTKWKHFFAGSSENNRLTAGPGLQLAKVEWKHRNATGLMTYQTRAANRLSFADSTSRSNLWLGNFSTTEAGVPNGIVDWRDQTNYNVVAPTWQRFADTSAYFIQVVLMIIYGTDTTYQPVL